MAQPVEIKLSLTVLISFFLHTVLFFAMVSPDLKNIIDVAGRISHGMMQGAAIGRDIIANINEDGKRVINEKTLLSENDSSARGFITQKQGDRWLNNSLDFKMPRGKGGPRNADGFGGSVESSYRNLPMAEESEVTVILERNMPRGGIPGYNGESDTLRIPDKNDVTRENALFYSNNGLFSFNTVKFKNFKYFKHMKDMIASNWFPPLLANARLGGYAPGITRIMAIPSQEVKLYFTMNRNGDVLNVVILDSMGNEYLDSSCIDSIRLSKTFGKVPDDLRGEEIVIPFIFGYYIN